MIGQRNWSNQNVGFGSTLVEGPICSFYQRIFKKDLEGNGKEKDILEQ